ncbi:MAG: S8 family serine peptidase [Proteobacteria bacterium]|nr:S8 family serine peptidase [Pseudomonadota bacterium]
MRIMKWRRIVWLALLLVSLAAPAAFGSVQADGALSPEPVYWYNGGVKTPVWMALDEAAVFHAPGGAELSDMAAAVREADPSATVTESNAFVTVFSIQADQGAESPASKAGSAGRSADLSALVPVYYAAPFRDAGGRMIPTGEIIVQFPASYSDRDVAALEAEYGLVLVEALDYAPNTFLYTAGGVRASMETANALYESGRVNYAYPNWLRKRTTRAVPNDPLFSDQWHLSNTGQGGGVSGEDVNITSAWGSYTGSSSEVIAIVDDGLEILHEDLSPNVLAGSSWDYVDSDGDPTGSTTNKHGTACAGVAAARGNNSVGVTGAAWGANLVGYRLLGAETDANAANAMTRNSGVVDVNSNSWGPTDDGKRLEGPGALTETALAAGVTGGRGGKGLIYTWAGGNGKADTDNSNYDGYANSRYTIAVGASTDGGVQSYYSENGANLLVNAPSNGGVSGITTTDRTAPLGYNASSNYTNTFGGTSSAAPLLSGIVALMLQANPNLTWRDVQHILARTAAKNDSTDADWTANGGGYLVNHKYGFGRVNASLAVAMATTWTSVATETSLTGSASPGTAIPDNDATGVSSTINFGTDITVEFVEIYFSAADHTYWRDLEVTLVSPSGTSSVLAEQGYPGALATGAFSNWRFGSTRHYGESSAGNWTLRVRDLRSTNTGTFQSWTIKVFGTARNGGTPTANPTSATGTGTIGIDLPYTSGPTLTTVTAIQEDDASLGAAGKPARYYFPHGLVGFHVVGLTPGATVTVRLTYPSAIPAGSLYYMAGAAGFTLFTNAVFSGSQAYLTLTDGGAGDQDGLANGTIVDPGGVAVLEGAAGGGDGGGGCFIEVAK